MLQIVASGFVQSIEFTPHDTKWMPSSARFVSCGITPGGKGALSLFELGRGELKTSLDCMSIHDNGIKCATFGASSLEDRNLAFGDYNGGLCIWDIERCASSSDGKGKCTLSGKSMEIFSVEAHNGIINAIDGVGGIDHEHGAPEIVTGGRDGCVKVWDPRVNNPVICLEPENRTSRDCWTVAFGDSYNNEDRCICAGFDNGDVKLFDLRTSSLRWESNCNNGVTSLEFDRKDIEMNKLVVTTLESKFRCYDMRTQHPSNGFTHLDESAHRSTIWLARHLPQNRDIFMTCGGNGGLNIYAYHYPKKRVEKHINDKKSIGVVGNVELLNSRVIATQPIVCFDWNPNRAGLCCMGCLDQSLRVYIVTKLDKY